MTVHKHPNLQIQEHTEQFLRHADGRALEHLLNLSFSVGIVPAKIESVIDEIETRGSLQLNAEVYGFIVNRIHKLNTAVPPESPAIQKLISGFDDLHKHIDNTKNVFLEQQNVVKSVGLASYLSYPYLAQSPVFVSACKNIDSAINSTFRKSSPPATGAISYTNDRLEEIRMEIAAVLLQSNHLNDKQRLVLSALIKAPAQDLRKIRYDLGGFDQISSAEITILRRSLPVGSSPSAANDPCDNAILKYIYTALDALGLTTKAASLTFDSNARTVIGVKGIPIDFDWILEIIQEINWETCADLQGVENFGNFGAVYLEGFYQSLNEQLTLQSDFLNVMDYQSHLIFKCDLNIADELPFEGVTSSIGYVLSLFEEGMLEERFVYTTPYRFSISDGEVADSREGIFSSAISACIKAGYPGLAVDMFIIGLLGHVPFIDALPDVRTLTRELLKTIDTVLCDSSWERSRIIDSIAVFSELIAASGQVKAIDVVEIKNTLEKIKKEYGQDVSTNVTLFLAPLPFSLPSQTKNRLDDYSFKCLDQIRLAYNQFLGEKNQPERKDGGSSVSSIALQHHFHPVWILVEHVARKYINPYLNQKSDSLGTLMIQMHRDTKIHQGDLYKVLCEDSGKSQSFFAEDLGRMRNWSMHPEKKIHI